MNRAAVAAILALLAAPAAAAERFAVIAVGDPPAGPDGDLAEMAYQLRAACRDRVPNVEDPSSMRARLLGQTSDATVSELDRAYGGALAVFQNGEFESSLRTLRAIVEDLEALPETDESYFQWKRALLRLAHSALAAEDMKGAEAAFGKLARVEPTLQPDPDQFSPSFRKRFEEVKAKVRALPRRKLTITAVGAEGSVFVNGKPVGTTPVTVTLPTGSYRVGGAAGQLRVPSFRTDLDQEDRTVVLDFALAASLRMNAGPGLALTPEDRANGVIRAGAWLGVDRLIVVTRSVEGQAHFLVGSIYDVLRGALLREGSVRMVAGGVPSVNLAALAAFLLTGQSSREVKDLSRDGGKRAAPPMASADPAPAASPPVPNLPQPAAPTAIAAPVAAGKPAQPAVAAVAAKDPAPAPQPQLDVRPAPKAASAPALARDPVAGEGAPPAGRKRWSKPLAIGTGVLAAGLGAFAIQQNLAANRAYSEARDQIGPDGQFKDANAQQRWNELRSEGERERRNAVICGATAAGLAVAAGIFGWNAWHSRPEQAAMLTIEF